jgi:hypothetical protein
MALDQLGVPLALSRAVQQRVESTAIAQCRRLVGDASSSSRGSGRPSQAMEAAGAGPNAPGSGGGGGDQVLATIVPNSWQWPDPQAPATGGPAPPMAKVLMKVSGGLGAAEVQLLVPEQAAGSDAETFTGAAGPQLVLGGLFVEVTPGPLARQGIQLCELAPLPAGDAGQAAAAAAAAAGHVPQRRRPFAQAPLAQTAAVAASRQAGLLRVQRVNAADVPEPIREAAITAAEAASLASALLQRPAAGGEGAPEPAACASPQGLPGDQRSQRSRHKAAPAGRPNALAAAGFDDMLLYEVDVEDGGEYSLPLTLADAHGNALEPGTSSTLGVRLLSGVGVLAGGAAGSGAAAGLGAAIARGCAAVPDAEGFGSGTLDFAIQHTRGRLSLGLTVPQGLAARAAAVVRPPPPASQPTGGEITGQITGQITGAARGGTDPGTAGTAVDDAAAASAQEHGAAGVYHAALLVHPLDAGSCPALPIAVLVRLHLGSYPVALQPLISDELWQGCRTLAAPPSPDDAGGLPQLIQVQPQGASMLLHGSGGESTTKGAAAVPAEPLPTAPMPAAHLFGVGESRGGSKPAATAGRQGLPAFQVAVRDVRGGIWQRRSGETPLPALRAVWQRLVLREQVQRGRGRGRGGAQGWEPLPEWPGPLDGTGQGAGPQVTLNWPASGPALVTVPPTGPMAQAGEYRLLLQAPGRLACWLVC